jgi:hypothetical protein
VSLTGPYPKRRHKTVWLHADYDGQRLTYVENGNDRRRARQQPALEGPLCTAVVHNRARLETPLS